MGDQFPRRLSMNDRTVESPRSHVRFIPSVNINIEHRETIIASHHDTLIAGQMFPATFL